MSTGRFLKEPVIATTAKSIGVPTGSTATRPEAPTFGTFRYNSDVGRLEYYNGTTFKQVALDGEKTMTVDTFTGDGTTATFTLSETPTGTGQILVFISGVHQEPDTHYTLATDDLIFNEPVPDQETITVIIGMGETPDS
jgi:hypothetical protein